MAGLTLAVYYVSRGNMNSKRRKELENNLNLGMHVFTIAINSVDNLQ
jgi:hypothetical protein